MLTRDIDSWIRHQRQRALPPLATCSKSQYRASVGLEILRRRHIKKFTIEDRRAQDIHSYRIVGGKTKAREKHFQNIPGVEESDSSHLSSHLSPKSPVFTMLQWTTRDATPRCRNRPRAVGQCHVVLPPSTGWYCQLPSVSKKLRKEATLSANSA